MRIFLTVPAVMLLSLAGTFMAGAEPTTSPPIVTIREPITSLDEAQIERGSALMDEHKFDDAITLFDTVLKRSPHNGYALANRAIAFGWTNRLKEAERDLLAAEAIIPDAAILHRIRAIIADRRSDDATLIDELTKSLAKEPGNVFALRFRARAYQRGKREADAMADADAYIKAHPDNPDAYVFKAELAIDQQQRPFAMQEAERLAHLFSDDAYSIAAAARIYDQLGERRRALELVTKAITIAPEDEYYYLLRAEMRRWDDLDGRLADLETAIALDANNPTTLTELGLVEFKRSHWSLAAAHFTRILDREPRDYGVLAYRAMANLKGGDPAAAKRDFESAMLAASGPDDFSLVCWALGREGQALNWAIEACDRAVELNGKESTYRSNRGLVRLRLGQLPEALQDYDAAVVGDERIASHSYGRAIVRMRMGDKQGARADRTRALALDPTIAETYEQYGFGADLFGRSGN